MALRFNSFEELGRYRKVSTGTPKPAKPKTCRKCGTVLREIAGTNVMVCDGTVDGKPCGNRVVKSIEFAT